MGYMFLICYICAGVLVLFDSQGSSIEMLVALVYLNTATGFWLLTEHGFLAPTKEKNK